jgi:glutathione transport system permease protein
LLLVLTLAFLLLRLAPGDPVTALIGDFNATPQLIAAMRQQYGLDQPVYVQYVLYVWHALQGDFGVSMRTGQNVLSEILKVFPYTLMLAGAAIAMAVVIGLPLGVISAIRPNSWLDHVTRLFALLGICTPGFALALVLMLIFSVYLDWLPLLGVGEPGDPGSLIIHLILPALALALRDAATIARLTRALMLSLLREDYITTARAKGLPEFSVIFKHALKNALVGVLTVISLEFSHTLGGAVVIETMFGRPGVGSLIVQAISARDYPQLQGTVLFFAFCIIVINLLTDLLYRAIDPRIEYVPAVA